MERNTMWKHTEHACAARRQAPAVAALRADDRRSGPLRSLPPHDVEACSAEEGGGSRKILSSKETADGEGTEEGRCVSAAGIAFRSQ